MSHMVQRDWHAIVTAGVTGLLVAAGDATALAAAIGRLADDATVRADMAEAGHQRACREFARERMIAETAALLDGVDAADGVCVHGDDSPFVPTAQRSPQSEFPQAPAAPAAGAERSE